MLGVLLASAVLSPSYAPDTAYLKDTSTWRQAVEKDLKRPQGWLALVGLTWLKQGDNTVGSDPNNFVVLPAPAPHFLGTIRLEKDQAAITYSAQWIEKFSNETAPKKIVLRSDATRIAMGPVVFVVINRGNRTGVRVWDSESKALKEFKGCQWFPTDEKYRIEADYTAYPTPKSMPITNVLGDVAPVSNPGYVTFNLNGKVCRLEAQAQGDGFFFNFADKTSGRETYPAGRFLDAPAPKDGKVLLDFNRATNPPCAFTSFATCPLPPSANRMDVAILAGEKVHHSGH